MITFYHFRCFAEKEEEKVLGEDPGISIASFSTGHVQGESSTCTSCSGCTYGNQLELCPGNPGDPLCQEVMAMAGSKDSFVQISSHLDQTMPGTKTVPTGSIREESQGMLAGASS